MDKTNEVESAITKDHVDSLVDSIVDAKLVIVPPTDPSEENLCDSCA